LKDASSQSPFHVPPLLHVLGTLVERYPAFWIRLGGLESQLLAQQIRSIQVRMPIYICGLARSGSTLLHEMISSHPGVATHRVKDYPMVFTPFWWRQATARLPAQAPRERIHRDRVMITSDSPDALEEMLWMAFFPRCHDPSISNVLEARDSHPAFEAFYQLHIRKLLLAEGANRYAAKANYHVARLSFLARLFPDARFIIPVRAPAAAIASLMRQHRWFCRGQRRHPRALAYMRRSGHFEFGLDRRPLHLGDRERVGKVQEALAAGDEVRGLARYWDMVYGYLARLLASSERVRKAALVVRFESLCATPAETLDTVFRHCALSNFDKIIERCAPSIRSPAYYDSPFGEEDLATICGETANTASLWNYEPGALGSSRPTTSLPV
jgi:Sulfotransferase family